ncbi:MAG: DoxX family protein [Acidobacteria bacterium]|nr:DoxX family protein [Acidobacteriota bacterium]MCA1632845.1 DoxX family protein [Acidobacteriota bacterium]MCA1640981.1 DoxX family protein [Acidobacteriota bacterium]
MFQRLIATAGTWIPVPLRIALGLIFIGHGAQKVFGAWGGPGWAKIISFPAPFSFMRPSWAWMAAAALSELIGGALLLTGLLTRVGAFLILCVMLTAMIGVHWQGGFFLPQGFEYTFALSGACVALLIAGGGRLSLDRVLQDPRARRR